jgi:ABC-2 type transport system permease protein
VKSVYSKTLYQKRFMALGWFLGVTGVVLLTMSVYNSFSSGAIGDSLQSLPPALQKLAGNGDSFKTVGGYISQQIFALRMPVLLTILSIAIFVGLTGGEEGQGLTESQLALPISRSKLLLQKLAAGLTVVLIASCGALLGIGLGLIVIGHSYNLLDVAPHLLNCLLVAVCYGLIGFTVASVSGRRGPALGAASGLAFLGFLINSMAASVSLFATLDHLTFFHYYQTSGGYNWQYIGLLAGLATLLVVISTVAFRLRDIRAR